MIQYFQLTPDILLEYVYEGDPKLNEDGIYGNERDILKDEYATLLLKSDAFSSKYFCFKNESEGLDSISNRISNLVLPLNNTETQFVVSKSDQQDFYKKTNVSNRFYTKTKSGYLYEDTQYDKDIIKSGKSCDVKYDKCIVHFTSRNYFGNYDSLIFQAYAYMSNKTKLYFASFLFKRTSNLELKAEHMLYNEKLYTTQIEFDIPSVYSILLKDSGSGNSDSDSDSDSMHITFNEVLSKHGITLLENTPICINLYGVSGSSVGTDNYRRLNTLKINSISIPYIYNRLDEIYIDISESKDGDYYIINPEVGKGYSSFVDYIESLGEDIRAYMIMHELKLKEVWVDNNGVTHSEITHKEFHIIDINEDDEDEVIQKRFDAQIKYRPVCVKSGFGCSATIIDTIKIINTIDSSSYEVTGSVDILNPKKYGLTFKTLNVERPIVNVYNKSNSIGKSGSGYGGSGSGSGSGSGGSGSGSGSGGSGSSDGGTPLGSIGGTCTGTLSGSGSGSGSGGSGSGSGSGGSGSGGSGSTDEIIDAMDASEAANDAKESFERAKQALENLKEYVKKYENEFEKLNIVIAALEYYTENYLKNEAKIAAENAASSNVIEEARKYAKEARDAANAAWDAVNEAKKQYQQGSGETSGTLSGKVDGNVPGLGKISGVINSKITGKYSESGAISIEGPINISLAGNVYGSSGNSNGGIIVINKSGGLEVVNNSQNITSFIECTNVAVSIVELSPEDIN